MPITINGEKYYKGRCPICQAPGNRWVSANDDCCISCSGRSYRSLRHRTIRDDINLRDARRNHFGTRVSTDGF